MLQSKEHAPTPYPSVIFTFKLAVESTKEFGGASPEICLEELEFDFRHTSRETTIQLGIMDPLTL